MLEHHADACGNRGLAVRDRSLLTLDENLAGVCFVEPIQDRHQRRLACTILADNAVDRAGHHADRDVLVGLNGAKGFGDAFEFDGGGLVIHEYRSQSRN